MSDFMRIPEASRLMGLSVGYIREHIKRGVSPFDKFGVRIPKEKSGRVRDSYYIIRSRYEAYQKGEL